MNSLYPINLRTHLNATDAVGIKALLDRTGLFRADEVVVALELVNDRLFLHGDKSDYLFVVAETSIGGAEGLAGFACYGRIPCTKASFDLYWIAVEPEMQGLGIGKVILSLVESMIISSGGQRLYAETSSQPSYETARLFYERCGFKRLAFLEDFYAEGDGKIIYGKKLTPPISN
ncbi:MAG: GNAT family N-acetyltransferase [Dissulfurimicrobium hydrothermale]|uniref:GNAT family N-acetyltransferase n=1 Tax=Dissulfurimicrobium hydrothermale TaxID=1750598 RepID=UPI003C72CF05